MAFIIKHIWLICQILMCRQEAYSVPCQTAKMDRFLKMVNDNYSLTVIAKSSILDIWEGCEYPNVNYDINSVYAYWTKWKGNINAWLFSLRDSSDRKCVFAELKKSFLSSKKSLLLNEFLQSEIMQKSSSVQNIAIIIAVADDSVALCLIL